MYTSIYIKASYPLDSFSIKSFMKMDDRRDIVQQHYFILDQKILEVLVVHQSLHPVATASS